MIWWVLIGLAAVWAAFAYLAYPVLVLLIARVSPRPIHEADTAPDLSVIIAVRNGEGLLRAKLNATLELDYPGSVEVIVASDASTDATDAIATSMANRGVHLVRIPARGGKEAAQAAAIEQARGEILVFTDLGPRFEPDALRCVVRPFADPEVGCVSSEDVLDSTSGEGSYVRLEMALRRLESRAGMLIGLSGSFFAARRSLCEPWPVELASDFRLALEASRRGLRAVSAPDARARFSSPVQPGAEWSRRVRTVRRGIAVLVRNRDLLHPRHGRIALALWGHKLARFTSPFALVVLFAASAASAPQSQLAALLFGTQAVGYALGALALRLRPLARLLIPRLAGFFLLVNASMLVAWGHHASGRRAVTWQPTRR